VFDEKRAELERHEFMMGVERGRLAVALDLLTDALILVGQHGVYCASSRNPAKPALDLQAVLGGMDGAKELIQSVMEETAEEQGTGIREQRIEKPARLQFRYLAPCFESKGAVPYPEGQTIKPKCGMLKERARSSAG
jgi:hypothetical protein